MIKVYDVNTKRVARVLKVARRYLSWVQNSVFEGEITESAFYRWKADLRKVADLSEDSFIFYIFRTRKYSDRIIMGVEKGSGWDPIL